MTKIIKPVDAKFAEVHIVKGNSLKQVLKNLSDHIEDQEIKTAWSVQIFESTKRKWQAVVTMGV